MEKPQPRLLSIHRSPIEGVLFASRARSPFPSVKFPVHPFVERSQITGHCRGKVRSTRSRIRRILTGATLGVATLLPFSATAWDGSVVGKIAAVEVTAGTNFGFPVWLVSAPQMYASGPGWASLNDTDSNCKTYVAALLLAKAQAVRSLCLRTSRATFATLAI
jgi:hypothetical protein